MQPHSAAQCNCILSLLDSGHLAIRPHHPLVYTSVLSPGFTENTVPTCRSPLVDALLSFLRLMLAMPPTSSPLGRLEMPLRPFKSFRTSLASLSNLKGLGII